MHFNAHFATCRLFSRPLPPSHVSCIGDQPNLGIVAQYGTLTLPPSSLHLRKPKGESSPRIGSDYATILNDLNWLPLSTRHKPDPHHAIYIANRNIFLPLIKTVAHKSSFFIDIIYLWNIPPLSVVSSQSLSSFKSALQKYVYTHSLSL